MIFLLVLKKTVTSFRYSFKVDLLDTFIVSDVDDKFEHQFKIVSVNLSYTFSCKSDDEKQQWIDKINHAILTLINSKEKKSRAEYHDARQSLAGSLHIDLSEDPVNQDPSSISTQIRNGLPALRKVTTDKRAPGAGLNPFASEINVNDLLSNSRSSKMNKASTQPDVRSNPVPPPKPNNLENPNLSRKPKPTQSPPKPPRENNKEISNNNNNNNTNLNIQNNQQDSQPIRTNPARNSRPPPNARPSPYDSKSNVSPYSASSRTRETTRLVPKQQTRRVVDNEDSCGCLLL